MSTEQRDDLDAQTLAAYRATLIRAANVFRARGQQGEESRVRDATYAVFAALDRRDARERAMLEIVQAVANMEACSVESQPHEVFLRTTNGVNVLWLREQARALVTGQEARR